MHDATVEDASLLERAAPVAPVRRGLGARGCRGAGRSPAAPGPWHADDVSPARDDGRAPHVRIYRPARSVLQAGRANAREWVLEFEPRSAPFVEPLMGWTGTRDTLRQVRLTFPTRERAVAFAERQGWAWTVAEPREPRLRPKSYAENFRFRPAEGTPRRPAAGSSAGPALLLCGLDRRNARSDPHDIASRSQNREGDAVDPVEEAGLESFPASDPPSWVGATVG